MNAIMKKKLRKSIKKNNRELGVLSMKKRQKNARKQFLLIFTVGFLFLAVLTPASNSESAPNLIIDSLKFDKTRIEPNESINITYQLRPEGIIPTCINMGIWCYKDSGGKQLKSWGLPSRLCNDLKDGKTISQTIRLKIPYWGPGVYEIVVFADVDNYLKENKRSDNEIRKTLTILASESYLPDLYIQEISLTPPRPTEKESVIVRVHVYNKGTAPSGSYEVEWWAGQNFQKPSCRWKVDSSATKGGRILDCRYKGYSRSYSNITSKAVVDPNNRIKELNKNNNIKTKRIQVSSMQKPTCSIAGKVTGISIRCLVSLYGPNNLEQINNSVSINAPGSYLFKTLPKGRYKIRIGGQALEDTWIRVIPPERVITCTGIAIKNIDFDLKR
jgi:hypothetical protein